MFAFLHAFAKVLPCKRCSTEFRALMTEHLGAHPTNSAHLDSRDALSRFVVDMHNRVNERLGRRPVSYEQARRWYVAAEGRGAAVARFRVALVALCLAAVAAIVWQRSRARRVRA